MTAPPWTLGPSPEARITEYLFLGGLFNPELMEHDKVRDLLIDCRTALSRLRALLPAPTDGDTASGKGEADGAPDT